MDIVKWKEQVVPLSDIKVNPGRVIKQASETHRPVLVTNQGCGIAVVQALNDYENTEEERAFMRAVIAGLADIEKGHEVTLAEAKKRLGIK
jgi:prevent-host-death family protein